MSRRYPIDHAAVVTLDKPSVTLREHLLLRIVSLSSSSAPPPVAELEAALAEVLSGQLVTAQIRLRPFGPPPEPPEHEAHPAMP